MSETKRVLKFPIEDSNQLVELVEGLTEIKVDMDVDSTPSSIEICVYGSEQKVKGAVEKIKKLVKESKSS